MVIYIDKKQQQLGKRRATCYYDALVLKQTVVLHMNISAKNPALIKPQMRLMIPLKCGNFTMKYHISGM